MTSPFLEAFKVGYAIANESEAKNARKTMFEATEEAESLIAQLGSGAIPTEDYKATMDRLNATRAKWMGAASATDMTYAEFKEDVSAFGNVDSRITDYSLGVIERGWGTPAAAEAAKGWAGVMNLEGDVDAHFDDNGHLVMQVTDRDGTKMPAMSYTPEQISQLRLTAQQGGFNSALMSEELMLKASEVDLRQAQTENTRATAENTRAQTEGIPVEQAQEAVKTALDVEKTTADIETARANAETAAARERREADAAAAAPIKEREAKVEAIIASVETPDFVEMSTLVAGGPFAEMMDEDPKRAMSTVQGIVRGAYQTSGRILTASEAARIAGADVTADEAAALLKQMPNATIDEIVALLEAG
jgi:hypothetical protein